jgi:hypothetical protein
MDVRTIQVLNGLNLNSTSCVSASVSVMEGHLCHQARGKITYDMAGEVEEYLRRGTAGDHPQYYM